MIVASAAVSAIAAPPARAAVPAGFTDELVVALASPTAFAFTPDGRMLITTQTGRVRVFENGALVTTPALSFGATTIPICTNSERGLLGIAVDPAFELNGFVYLFYTFNKFNNACPAAHPPPAGTPVNRVARFTMSGNTIDHASQVVLVDNMPSTNGNHNAGDLHFGSDGYLYATVGDGGGDYAGDSGTAGSNDAARDQHVLTGKLLRITATGGIPPDNPFQGADADLCAATGGTTAGRKCRETYAWGLRNPFRIATDPNSVPTRVAINDVGQGAREEVDLLSSGADYGWNCREGTRVNSTSGPCSPTPAGMVDPVFEYSHGATVPGTTSPTNCNSITGGAFVPNGAWPAAYDNSYLISDFVCGWIFKLTPNGSAGFTASDFATNLGAGSVVHLAFGPRGAQQALYYATLGSGGQIRRIFPGAAPPYIPLAPARIIDTRPGQLDGDGFNTVLGPGSVIDIPVLGRAGIPETGVGAVALNVTATDVTASTYVTVWPRGDALPVASNLNLVPGQTAANLVVAKVGTAGRLSIRNHSGTVNMVVDVAGWFPTGSNAFTPRSPVRILDTRPGELAGDGFETPIPADTAIRVQVGGRGGVPADAVAVVMNVTITEPTLSTFLTVFPGGSSRPLASNLNAGAMRTAPNLVLTKLGSDGTVEVYNRHGNAHAIFDVAGWVSAGATGVVAATPSRILDTRPGELDGDGLNQPIGPNGTIDVAVAGLGGVPNDARAVVLNVTATNPSQETHLTVYPTGTALPVASNLNVRAGESRPNLVIAKLGTDGKLSVHNSSGTVDVIFDVAGWFT